MKKKMLSLLLCSTLIGASVSPVYATCFTSEPQAEETMFSAGSAQEEEDATELFTSSEEENASEVLMTETDIDAVVTGLQIVKDPDRTELYYGLDDLLGSDSFDLTGMEIEVSYSDNTRQLLEYTDFYDEAFVDSLYNTFSCHVTNMDGSDAGTDYLNVGDYLLTVEYDSDSAISDTTTIHVMDPAGSQEMTLGNNGTYTAGVKASGGFACVKFVPEESGAYVITAEEPKDAYIGICDSSYVDFSPRFSKFVAGNTYYVYTCELYEQDSFVQFVAKKAPEIKSVELVKKPARNFIYQHIDKSLSLIGGLLKITYEDGTTENVATSDRYGFETRTQYAEEVKISLNPDGSASDLKPGTYDAYLFVGDYKVNTVIKNFKIKSLNEIPVINEKGEKSISTYECVDIYMRLKTGKTTKYLIESSFRGLGISVREIKENGIDEKRIWVRQGEVCTLKPNTTYLLGLTIEEIPLPSKITFTATPSSKSYNFSKAKISGTSTFAYTGKEVKPNFTVKYGKKTLKKNKDYTITYYNNKNLGTARAVLYGKGIYSGIIEKEFKIKLKTPSAKVAKSGSSAVKVSWSKVTGAQGYVVERSTGKTWSKVATVKGKTYFTDKKVKKGTTYKYRVRAYRKVDNKNTYSSYSSVKAIKR